MKQCLPLSFKSYRKTFLLKNTIQHHTFWLILQNFKKLFFNVDLLKKSPYNADKIMCAGSEQNDFQKSSD